MLEIKILKSPHSFASNTYLIHSAGEYAVVDPSAPYSKEECDGVVKYVLLTHTHFDHILEVDSWVNNTGAEVIVSNLEVDALSDPMRNCFKLYNGSDNGYFGPARGVDENDVLPLGDTKIKILYTPGHTIGGQVYIVDDIAFVGDTVFEGGSYGRYDLPTGNLVMLRDSIMKVTSLPDNTVLYPGHGDKTTVKQYKKDMIFTFK